MYNDLVLFLQCRYAISQGTAETIISKFLSELFTTEEIKQFCQTHDPLIIAGRTFTAEMP